jgi:hypothetical protein
MRCRRRMQRALTPRAEPDAALARTRHYAALRAAAAKAEHAITRDEPAACRAALADPNRPGKRPSAEPECVA